MPARPHETNTINNQPLWGTYYMPWSRHSNHVITFNNC